MIYNVLFECLEKASGAIGRTGSRGQIEATRAREGIATARGATTTRREEERSLYIARITFRPWLRSTNTSYQPERALKAQQRDTIVSVK